MRIFVVTDASFCVDTGAAGVAWVVLREEGEELIRSGTAIVTERPSSIGELETTAMQKGLVICRVLGFKDKHLEFHVDCQEARRLFRAKFPHLTTQHIQGHTTRPGLLYTHQRWCDKQSRAAMRSQRQQLLLDSGFHTGMLRVTHLKVTSCLRNRILFRARVYVGSTFLGVAYRRDKGWVKFEATPRSVTVEERRRYERLANISGHNLKRLIYRYVEIQAKNYKRK